MVLGVFESMAIGPMVRVYGRDGMGMCGTCVCIGRRLFLYWRVNLVHTLSGQKFACAMLMHGSGGFLLSGLPLSSS